VDPGLSDKGVHQCHNQKLQQAVRKLDFDYIIVSPLRRTFDTIYNILKQEITSNSLKAKIIVLPIINEFGNIATDVPDAIGTDKMDPAFAE